MLSGVGAANDSGGNPYGLAIGFGGGRTDKNNVAVGSGSYVLPADVVAGLGDGNSLGGAKVFNDILTSMPWGIKIAPNASATRRPPEPPHYDALMAGITGQRADGGETKQVPIVAADGEIIAGPNDVLRFGQHYSSAGDLANYPRSRDKIMRRGHAVLDTFVKSVRGRTIKHLASLRGPVGSKDSGVGHFKTRA